jgi:hypothetical protein
MEINSLKSKKKFINCRVKAQEDEKSNMEKGLESVKFYFLFLGHCLRKTECKMGSKFYLNYFQDVAGLENAKKALQEAVILPIKFPQIF